MARMKIVYVCKVCNAYLTKEAEDAVPLCCGKVMIVMDKLSEDEMYEKKESSGGL